MIIVKTITNSLVFYFIMLNNKHSSSNNKNNSINHPGKTGHDRASQTATLSSSLSLPMTSSSEEEENSSSSSSPSSPGAAYPTMVETCDRLVEKLKPKLLSMLDDNSSSPSQQQQQQPTKQYWICCCGGPGSGKTTFSELIASKLNKIKAGSTVVIPMDGYHTPKSQLVKKYGVENGLKRRGAPYTFDVDIMYNDLYNAKINIQLNKSDNNNNEDDVGAIYSLPIYSREISDPIPNGITLTRNHQIVIVEGIYLLHTKDNDWKKLVNLWDEKWFIKCTTREEQINRLVARSLKTWSKEKAATWGEGIDGATKRVMYNDVQNMDLIAYCESLADEIIISK